MTADTTIFVLDEKVALFKRDFPNLVTMWSLTQEEIVKMCAADQMSLTFGSKPADWIVTPRELCDEAKCGTRATLPADKHYPVRFVEKKK